MAGENIPEFKRTFLENYGRCACWVCHAIKPPKALDPLSPLSLLCYVITFSAPHVIPVIGPSNYENAISQDFHMYIADSNTQTCGLLNFSGNI